MIDHFTIAYGKIYREVDLIITDITGKIVYTTNARETQMMEVNKINFSKGVYIVSIQLDESIKTVKLIVKQ